MDGDGEGLGEEGLSVFVLAVEFFDFVVSPTTSMSCVLPDSERPSFSTFLTGRGVAGEEFNTEFLPDSFKESVAGSSAVVFSS